MTYASPMGGPTLPEGSELTTPDGARVRIGDMALAGELALVPGATGLVVIAQAGGGRAERPRNRLLVAVLRDYRLSTLLLDLLADAGSPDGDAAVDAGLLHQRLEEVLRWISANPGLGQARLGLLGAGAGAAAALRSAVQHPAVVAAVVSRGGTPGQARAWLTRVLAPTLLVVGADDDEALASNRAAMRALTCEVRLEVLPRVSRRFDEPGVTETVAHLAGAWFSRHLSARAH